MPQGLRERKKEQTRQLIADTAWRLFRLEAFGAELVEAVATRPVGEPVMAAFRRAMLTADGRLAQVEAGDRQALERLRTVNRVIAASSALQAREHQAIARTAAALAALLASETGALPGDLVARAAANALVGVQRALVDYTRARVLANQDLGQLATDVRRAAQHAFAVLEHGLGDYALKPGQDRPQ
ncbi:MAG TPA: TetR family transcriptional regulator [Actinomycetes bacterium]|nr:TetR family transcriptional regulator [Actinomycetes bacterium]